MELLRRLLLVGPHTCPWWLGYTFDNPLRRLVHDPVAILGDLVKEGYTVVDIGCGLGYFSLALADLVGPNGKVIALDIQPEMLLRSRRRAQRRGLAQRIEFVRCASDALGDFGQADFALAFWMVHEVDHPRALLAEVRSFLRPSGRLLIAEPKVHVRAERFAATVEDARAAGFTVVEEDRRVRFSRSVLCSVPPDGGGGDRSA